MCNQEQRSDWFMKINQRCQVPVLVDGDFVLTESRAIACYLANQHAGSPLYPIDAKQRAVVDQMLYLDATYIVPTWYDKAIVSLSFESHG